MISPSALQVTIEMPSPTTYSRSVVYPVLLETHRATRSHTHLPRHAPPHPTPGLAPCASVVWILDDSLYLNGTLSLSSLFAGQRALVCFVDQFGCGSQVEGRGPKA